MKAVGLMLKAMPSPCLARCCAWMLWLSIAWVALSARGEASTSAAAETALLGTTQTAVKAHIFGQDPVKIHGNRRIPEAAILAKLRFSLGEAVHPRQMDQSIHSLLSGDFFEDAKIEVDAQGVLHIRLYERPILSQILFRGNNKVPKGAIDTMLEDAEITVGNVYSLTRIKRFQRLLEDLYLGLGHQQTEIHIHTAPSANHTLSLNIEIREGFQYKIEKIDITGNHDISDRELLGLMQSSHFKYALRSSNLYEPQKLEADLNRIQSWYQQRGYLNYRLIASKVVVQPYSQRVRILIQLHEGPQWRIGRLTIKSRPDVAARSDLAQPEPTRLLPKLSTATIEQSRKVLTVQPDEVANLDALKQSVEQLANYFKDLGYPFASVQALENQDIQNQRIDYLFLVHTGTRALIRRIHVQGNVNTSSLAVRKQLRVYEGQPFIGKKLKLSQDRLSRTGLFDQVEVRYEPVAGSADQVDVFVNVLERDSSYFRIGGGWQSGAGLLFSTSVLLHNYAGLGHRASFELENTEETQKFSVNYFEPTINGFGLSRRTEFRFSNTQTDASSSTASYLRDVTYLKRTYGIPITEYNTLFASLRLEYSTLDATSGSSDLVQRFSQQHPSNTELAAEIGWSYDSRNDAIFPETGLRFNVGLESTLLASDLRHAVARMNYERYHDLSLRWTLYQQLSYSQLIDLGGSDQLPIFFRYYKAGGVSLGGSVRGYRYHSIPNQVEDPDGIGGDRRLVGRLELLYDLDALEAGLQKTRRWGFFLDAGKIWLDDEGLSLSSLDGTRFSFGSMFYWFTPIGPISISYGYALNAQEDDLTDRMQLSWGTAF